MEAQAAFLKEVRIFADLSDAEIGGILTVLHSRSLHEGDILFREGDPGGELYVVESGSLGISVTLADGKNLEIASFSRGDFFGEMSIFEKEPRSATCYVKDACRLLVLNERELFQLSDSSPASARKVMGRMLAVTRARLEDAGEFLSDMVQWGEEARKRAITDPLTGLHNRRFLEETLEEYLKKARTGSKPLAMVMLDLDHFRQINERHSEAAGDRVIIAAAGVFRRHLRPTDVAARYGGDEFTFLLPETDADKARGLMEAIRSDVEQLNLAALIREPAGSDQNRTGCELLRVTTSQGIACFPNQAADSKALREAADRALYRAKELGRNRVVLAQEQE